MVDCQLPIFDLIQQREAALKLPAIDHRQSQIGKVSVLSQREKE
jgi:hypothetical protein